MKFLIVNIYLPVISLQEETSTEEEDNGDDFYFANVSTMYMVFPLRWLVPLVQFSKKI